MSSYTLSFSSPNILHTVLTQRDGKPAYKITTPHSHLSLANHPTTVWRVLEHEPWEEEVGHVKWHVLGENEVVVGKKKVEVHHGGGMLSR